MKRQIINNIASMTDLPISTVRDRCEGMSTDDLVLIHEIVLFGGHFFTAADQIQTRKPVRIYRAVLIVGIAISLTVILALSL